MFNDGKRNVLLHCKDFLQWFIYSQRELLGNWPLVSQSSNSSLGRVNSRVGAIFVKHLRVRELCLDQGGSILGLWVSKMVGIAEPLILQKHCHSELRPLDQFLLSVVSCCLNIDVCVNKLASNKSTMLTRSASLADQSAWLVRVSVLVRACVRVRESEHWFQKST